MSQHTRHANDYTQVVVADAHAEHDRVAWSRYLWTGALLLLAFIIAVLCFRGAATDSEATPHANHESSQNITHTPNGIEQIGVPSKEIALEWDGPGISLDWTGGYILKAKETFVGSPVIVPGDMKEHTLTLTNDGPSSAVLDVWIDPAEYIPEAARNSALAEDVTVFWSLDGVAGSLTFAELLAHPETPIAEVKMDQGETMVLTVGIQVDHDLERSKNEGFESTLLQFDVGIGVEGQRTYADNPLAITGGITLWPLVVCALLLFIAGMWLLVLRRRRDDEEEDELIISAPQQGGGFGQHPHSR